MFEALYVMKSLFATTPFGRVDEKRTAFELDGPANRYFAHLDEPIKG